MNLDEQLTIQESRRRGRLITFGLLGVFALVVGVASYVLFFREDADKARPTEDIAVGRATMNANLVISGVAEAQLISDLSFRTGGRVDAVSVKVGDTVKRGDVLAGLESDDLSNNVAVAQTSLALSQARLAALLEAATEADRRADMWETKQDALVARVTHRSQGIVHELPDGEVERKQEKRT